jgi:hypothetical protein
MIGSSQKALVTITALITVGTAGDGCAMSFSATGASASDAQSVSLNMTGNQAQNSSAQTSATYLVTGLTTGSNTFTAKYKNVVSNCTFANRSIIVTPY